MAKTAWGCYRAEAGEGKDMELKTKRVEKRKNFLLMAVGAGLLLFAWLLFVNNGKGRLFSSERVLTIGVFSDSYWEVQNGYSYRILEDAAALFEERNPGVRVEYVSGILKEDYGEWLAEQVLLGTAPDLFFLPGSNFNDFAKAGALQELDGMIAQDGSFAKEDYYSPAFSGGFYEGECYALPYECAPKLMFMNKTILDKEGIPIPGENWTWEDFYEICKAVTKDTDGNGTLDQFGMVGYTWEDAFDANGVSLFDEKGTVCDFTQTGVLEALTFLERLQGLYGEYAVSERDFDLGNVVFQPMLFSEYRAYKAYPLSVKKYAGFDWECLPMPAGPGGSNVAGLDTLMLAMNAGTHYQKEAWEFMKVLTAEEEIQAEIFDYSEGVSVLRQVTESEQTLVSLMEKAGESGNFNLEVLSNAVEGATVLPRFDNYEEAAEEVDKAVRDILEGSQNISMGQIIWNRRINSFLKERES